MIPATLFLVKYRIGLAYNGCLTNSSFVEDLFFVFIVGASFASTGIFGNMDCS